MSACDIVKIEFQVQVWRSGEWEFAAGGKTREEAESKMLAMFETGAATRARVVEVTAVITRKVVIRAAHMGRTSAEIVAAVVEGRHL